MSDAIQRFTAAIAAAGLAPPDTIHPDGKLHRFSASGKRGDDTGWYVLHLDGVPAGVFGCWRQGITETWCDKADSAMTPMEREAHRQRIKAMQAQREAEQVARQREAAAEAARRWQDAKTCAGHPYLSGKGVQAHGARSDAAGGLLIPMRDTEGTLHSLQTITTDGEKRFLPGGRVKGCYHAIGKPKDNKVILCEGFATGASAHEATGEAVAIAYNAGNLKPVAVALREKYPSLKIIVAADDDYRTEGNPGITKATEAAQAVGGCVAVPDFGAHRPDGATDFNDLHQLRGPEAVRACIEAAIAETPEPVETGGASGSSVVLVNGADLTPEPVMWLWRFWLALGKLHILAGAPGQGKTTIALAFAAILTSGGRWPCGARCEPGNVLIWSGEDDPADTLLPRLLAAGADRTRCYFVQGTRVNGELVPFDPAAHMTALEETARAIGGVRLLIVDPVVSAVAGDSHKNTEVRRALQPLVDLGARLGAAVLGISHFSKGGAGSDPASRVVGSIAFTAVARVVLVAAKVKGEDDESADRRILARGKSNIGPDDGGYEYTIEQAEPLPGIHASYVQWGEGVEGTARELLHEPEASASSEETENGGARRAAADFLRQVLADGLTPTKTVEAEAKAAGVSWASVRRAAEDLRVVKRRGDGGLWYWKLPNLLIEVAQDAQLSNVEQVEQVGEQHEPLTSEALPDMEVF